MGILKVSAYFKLDASYSKRCSPRRHLGGVLGKKEPSSFKETKQLLEQTGRHIVKN